MTLIEVLLVVALMAILAGLAIPNANPSILEQLRSSASIVAADLAYARSQSVTYGDNKFCMTFSTDGGEYEIKYDGANPALDDVLQNPFDNGSSSTNRYLVVLADLPSLGPQVHLAAVSTIDAEGEPLSSVSDVYFGSLGDTYNSDGTSRPEDTRIWLAVGTGTATRTITVRVNSVTGLATVESPGEYALPEAALMEAMNQTETP